MKKLAVKKGSTCMACLECVRACPMDVLEVVEKYIFFPIFLLSPKILLYNIA